MRLTNEQVAKYQAIYKKTFGKTISKDEALVQGLALLRLVKNLAQPPESNEMEKNNESTSSIT